MEALQGVKLKSVLQPILLHGHEGPITQIKYNLDGDLIFTAAKDKDPTVWYSDTGERLGTYADHDKGAVWSIDPSFDSKYVLTASADQNARLFNTVTGELLLCMPHSGVVRGVAWSEGNHMFATINDWFTTRDAGIIVYSSYPMISLPMLRWITRNI